MKFKSLLIFFIISNAFAFDHKHTLWGEVLKEHVTYKGAQSSVNYNKLKKTPETFNKYLKNVSSLSKKEFSKFTKNQKLAFLINAYNAYTVQLIINNYPV